MRIVAFLAVLSTVAFTAQAGAVDQLPSSTQEAHTHAVGQALATTIATYRSPLDVSLPLTAETTIHLALPNSNKETAAHLKIALDHMVKAENEPPPGAVKVVKRDLVASWIAIAQAFASIPIPADDVLRSANAARKALEAMGNSVATPTDAGLRLTAQKAIEAVLPGAPVNVAAHLQKGLTWVQIAQRNTTGTAQLVRAQLTVAWLAVTAAYDSYPATVAPNICSVSRSDTGGVTSVTVSACTINESSVTLLPTGTAPLPDPGTFSVSGGKATCVNKNGAVLCLLSRSLVGGEHATIGLKGLAPGGGIVVIPCGNKNCALAKTV